jgi:hypothetical protein
MKHKLGMAAIVIKLPIWDDTGTKSMLKIAIKDTIIPRK